MNVKAFFKGCPVSDRRSFNQSKCLMPISVGVKLHEGEKFLATIKLIGRTFRECVLLIDDTVQRYTLNIIDKNKNLDQLYYEALRQGDLWIERNRPIYITLPIAYTVIRWDKWLKHANYSKQKKVIDALYETDMQYKEAFDISIKDFLTRYQKNSSNLEGFDYNRAYQLCLAYLKEECACMCLWVEEDCQFEVYPSGRNLAMVATYEKLIKPFYPNLLTSVSLYFKKNKTVQTAVIKQHQENLELA